MSFPCDHCLQEPTRPVEIKSSKHIAIRRYCVNCLIQAKALFKDALTLVPPEQP